MIDIGGGQMINGITIVEKAKTLRLNMNDVSAIANTTMQDEVYDKSPLYIGRFVGAMGVKVDDHRNEAFDIVPQMIMMIEYCKDINNNIDDLNAGINQGDSQEVIIEKRSLNLINWLEAAKNR